MIKREAPVGSLKWGTKFSIGKSAKHTILRQEGRDAVVVTPELKIVRMHPLIIVTVQ